MFIKAVQYFDAIDLNAEILHKRTLPYKPHIHCELR